MSELPEWLREDSPCPHGGAIDFSDTCSKCTEQAFKALRIAWEALSWYELIFRDPKRIQVTVDRTVAIDAMKRINDLGNGGVGK